MLEVRTLKSCSNDLVQYEGLVLNYMEQTAKYDDKDIIFTNREFQVLYLLMQYPGLVLSKRQIYAQVAENDNRDDFHTIEITISRIRKKIEQHSGRKDFILTIRGRGYKFRK